MKSNVLVTGLASVMCLSLLVSCNDRMGQMRSHTDLRAKTCVKHNEFLRKMNKKPDRDCPGLGEKGGKNPGIDDSSKKITRKNPTPIGGGEGDQIKKPTPGGSDPVQDGSVSREEFMKQFNESLSVTQPNLVRGISVTSGAAGDQVVLAVEAVVSVEIAAGQIEDRSLFIKSTPVTPFASQRVTRINNLEVKKNGSDANENNGKIVAMAACQGSDCKKIALLMQFEVTSKEGRPNYGFAVCSINTGVGIEKCNFELRDFASAQSLPTRIEGDQSGSGTKPVPSNDDQLAAESHQKILSKAGEIFEALAEELKLFNEATGERDLTKAEASFDKINAAVEALVATEQDLAGQPNVNPELRKKAEEMSKAGQERLVEVKKIIEEMRAKAPAASGDQSGAVTAPAAPGDQSGAVTAPAAPGDQSGAATAPALPPESTDDSPDQFTR